MYTKVLKPSRWFSLVPFVSFVVKIEGLMKKILGYLLKIISVILGLLVVVILLFTVQANLRESKTRHEAAPSTGRFVQAGDVELYIQEVKPSGNPHGTIIFIHGTAAWSGL